MKRTFFILALMIAIIVFVFFFFQEREEKFVSLVDEGREIEVLDPQGEAVLQYSIEEFKEWAKQNWDVLFEEPPAFGELREVSPDHFYRFDRSVSLSPDFRFVVFSVNDYAAATTLSFVGIIDIGSKKVDLVRDISRGGIEEFLWSPSGSKIAYILNTARAGGDYISVVDTEKMQVKLVLSDDDVLEEMPFFDNLSWSSDGKSILFSSKNFYWRFSFSNDELEMIDDRIEGNLMINNPGMEEGVWYVSYEDPGHPGLMIKLALESSECPLCLRLLEQDKSLSGERVEIRGERDEEYLKVKDIKQLAF